MGFTSGMLVTKSGIFRGYGTAVELGGQSDRFYLDENEMQNIAMEHGGWDDDDYPNSLLGSIALIRQTFYDSRWYDDAWSIFNSYPKINKMPAIDDGLSVISKGLEDNIPFFFYINKENEIDQIKSQYNLEEDEVKEIGN